MPLGNGRLGMMPDGGISHEHIVLNEISLWSGSESDYRNPDAARSLPQIRQLLFEGKNLEAQELMYSSFVPKKQETDGRYGSYQVLGNLDLRFRYAGADTVAEAYVRELSLRDGVARTSFTRGGVRYERTYFVSRQPDVMFIRLVADRPGALSFSAALGRQERCSLAVEDDALVMSGQLDSGNPDKAGMKYRVAMRLIAKDGKTSASAEGLTLEGGTEACYGQVDGLIALRNNNTTDEHLKNVMLFMDYICSGDRIAACMNELYLDPVCQSGRDALTVEEGRDQANLDTTARLIALVNAPPAGVTAEMNATAETMLNEHIVPKVQSLLAGEMSAQEVYDYIVEAAHSEFGAENCVSGKI